MPIFSKMPRLHTFDSWIYYPNYRFLWIGNFSANGAQWLQLLSVGWLVQQLTEGTSTSALLVITVGAINTLPSLFVSPWGGVLGDRLDRRKLVMSLQLFMTCMAFFFALLILMDWIKVWHAYSYVLISGVCRSLIQPLRQALVANTVPKEAIGNAFATNVLTITGTRLIGPFFGGILIAFLGFFWNFIVEGLLYLGMVLAFLPMRTPYFQPRKESQRKSFFSDIKEGIVYIWKGERVILNLMILSLIPNVLLHPVWFMFPIFTVEVLKAGPDVGGYLLAITGLGGLIAALTISSFGFIFKKGKVALVSVICSSVTVIIFAQSPWVPVAFVVIAAMAFFQAAFRTANGTLIQTLVPDELRSRITSLQGIGRGLVVFSSLAIGWFISLTSVVFAITTIGVAGVALSAFLYTTFKKIKNLE
ncbi:MAG: MFS transporter [Chloroflexota bacterium]|nr:MFS transporter [Chloroflexota bacterium]